MLFCSHSKQPRIHANSSILSIIQTSQRNGKVLIDLTIKSLRKRFSSLSKLRLFFVAESEDVTLKTIASYLLLVCSMWNMTLILQNTI